MYNLHDRVENEIAIVYPHKTAGSDFNDEKTQFFQINGNPQLLITYTPEFDDEGELLENTEQEQALHDLDGQDGAKVKNASSETTEIILPPDVTLAPRNDEEMHLGLLKGNMKGILTYLRVSDDKGELFGDTQLEQERKAFCEWCDNVVASEIQDADQILEYIIKLGSRLYRNVNMVESGIVGIFTKRRIEIGEYFNYAKKLVTATKGPVWEIWFADNFNEREFRSVEDYMALANIPGIKRYSVFGKERLLQIKRQQSDDDKKTADPIGAFIKRNGIDFNPEEEVDVKELKLKTDIAINFQKCLNAGLEIPIDRIECYVLNGNDVDSKLIDALNFRKRLGQDIVIAFDEVIASGGKLQPKITPKKQAEDFQTKTQRFIKAVDSAIKNPNYLLNFEADQIPILREKLQLLEQKLLAIPQKTPDVPGDAAKLSLNQGGN